jgi:hypothetical protein
MSASVIARAPRVRTPLLLLGVLLLPALARAQEPAVPADLRDVLATGWLVQDRNGDGLADFVNVRIVIPVATGAAESAAAANIAARLAWESLATNLDLVIRDAAAPSAFDAPVVLVGRTALDARLPAGARAAGLRPGEGSIGFVTPGGAFRQGAVVVEGGDATGLLAAADYLAGRYPSVWAVRGGTTYAQFAGRLERFLEQHGAAADAVAIERIVVDAARPGVSRVHVAVRYDAAEPLERAAAALAGDTVAAPRDTAAAGPVRRVDLDVQDVHRIDVRLFAPGAERTVRLLPPRPWPARAVQEAPAAAATDFSLTELYTVGGLYRDTRQDLVPDRTEAFLSLHDDAAARGAAAIATRIGVETAGMRFPIARVGGEDDYPQRHGIPIIYGSDHYQARRLREEGRLHGSVGGPGAGFIEFVPRAFGGRHGIVIGGSDARGLDAIAGYVAGRMPYLWDHGKGEYRLSDVETEVRRFFQARDAAGQISLGLEKLDTFLARLDGRAIDSLDVQLAVQSAPPRLDAHVQARLREAFPAAQATASAHTTGFGVGRPIFEEEVVLPWEVDEVRAALAEVLPRIGADSRGRVEVRVSESPEQRARLETEIRGLLADRGATADAFDVRVLSAYKQGYSWLHDVVLPRLRGRDDIARIDIGYHTLRDSREVRWQQIEADTRWLQELFPIDAVYARELGISDSVVVFTPTLVESPVYTVHVTDSAGATILRDEFDPRYVVRPYFDLFPEYEQVRVTTGWLTVESDGRVLADRRIRTDPEAFWDHLQTEVFGRIIEYVMDIQDGRPSPANAPYFDELRIDLTMSEPDYRIGIDEELISSLESLHEDIYFQTLMLFDLIGQRWGVPALSYPGRVLPYIHPSTEGEPGRARIRFTGKERGVPELVLTWREQGGEPVRERYPLAPLGGDAPKLRGVGVRAGQSGVAQLLFEVVATDSVVDYEAYRERGTESAIDRTFLPATLLDGMLGQLRRLHGDGLLHDALSFDRVGELAFRYVLRDTAASFARLATLRRSPQPRSTRNPILFAAGYWHDGRPLVQWQTPIPPAESDSVLARLATFPGVNVYHVAQSFLGRDIFAADFLPPFEATHVSQARLNALRPTLFLSGRQHANEVSSTSHILRLGELLATDSTYREMLRRVNVVLHPIANPDGAQLAYDMQLLTPDHMLHAGYLGALGVDMTAGAGSDDPIYPESQARPEIQRTWLPDIFINLHGYPSHEWVQLFSGYSAWVRGRTGTQRSWWAPRGWFIPSFTWVDDPRYPELKTAQFAVLDTIAAAITGLEDVEAMNRRQYARYARYGRQDVENFREHFHDGMLIYMSMRGRDASGTGINSPRITWFSATTEAPDETARGEWLELVASAGLAHTAALLRYLYTGVNRVEREVVEYDGVVMRSVYRRRPVLPDEG